MWPTDYGFESGLQAAESSLNKLGTDYLGNPISTKKTKEFNYFFHDIVT